MAFNLSEINFPDLLTYTIWNNSVKDYLTALAVFVLSFIVLKIFKFIIIARIKKLTAKTKTEIDDLIVKIIDKVGWPFYILLSLHIALQFIQIPDLLKTIIYFAILIVFTYYVIRAIITLIDYGIQKVIAKRREEEKEVDTSVINLLGGIVKGVLWGVAVILILSNLGYDITTLIAGLGVAGLAIAFGLQQVLADIFASFSIYFDKPFKVGDFIIVGSDMGVVKKIGIKSTRLESLWGQEIVISNRELTDSRINNYKKMERRRIHFAFGVIYGTPTEKMKKIPKIVKDIFEKIEAADLDRVHFKEFGDFSLNYEVAYYVNTGDYNIYMNTQQAINLALKEEFENEGIEFAFPTQTIFINRPA